MVLQTRRGLLRTTTLLLAGLSGCGQSSGDGGGDDGSDESGAAIVTYSGSTTDPSTVVVRGGAERPPVRLVEPDGGDADGDGPESTPAEWRSSRISNVLVDTPSRADRLVVDAPDGGVDADAVSSFVAATTFDAEAIYLETIRVRACFRLELCRVSWSADEVETDYARVIRPYDERCAADRRIFSSRLVRIPAPIDRESVHGFASSVGGGRCATDEGGRAVGGRSREREGRGGEAARGGAR
jgi:hypothetical protein